MLPLRIVLDTNAILRCLPRRSEYAVVLDKLYENAYVMRHPNEPLIN